MLKAIAALFRALNRNSHPGEIAHALSVSMMLGFMPKNNAFWYLLLLFFFFVRIHKGAYLIGLFLFSLLAPALDVLFDWVGYGILSWAPLRPLLGRLMEIPFVAFTHFNNTVVMGSFAVGMLAYLPVYAFARLALRGWRTRLLPYYRKSKLGIVIERSHWIESFKKAIDTAKGGWLR